LFDAPHLESFKPMKLPAASDSLTFSDYVFDHLRADIVSGVLPPQTRLGLKELTARYQVGMSPIREALHRLVGEGFVQTVGQRGFTVPPLSLEDLEDLTLLRTLVEETALRQAIARGDDAWEARIVAAFHRLELQVGRFDSCEKSGFEQYEVVHRAFHASLYAGVVSPRLSALHLNLFDQAHRYRKTLLNIPISSKEILREHRHIMDVVLSRDTAKAVDVLCHHLKLTRESTRRYLSSAPDKPAMVVRTSRRSKSA
jgi:DNA-binding GntR family transcriptional regulator